MAEYLRKHHKVHNVRRIRAALRSASWRGIYKACSLSDKVSLALQFVTEEDAAAADFVGVAD